MHHLHPYLYYQSAHAPVSSVKLKRDHAECILGEKNKKVWIEVQSEKHSEIQKQRKYHSYFQNSHLFHGYARFIEGTQKWMGENGDEEEQKKNCFREELYTCALKASFQKLPS
jgi:hypothetical protein